MFEKMSEKLKQRFCKHEFEICRKVDKSGFHSIRGEQLYKVCFKCGKVEKYIYREFEATATNED